MSNPDRGQVSLAMGAKTYALQFDNNAIRILEGHLGCGIAYVLQNFEKLAGVDFVCKAIHAGLQYEESMHRKLSIGKIANLLPAEKFEDALGAIVKGLLGWRGIDPENEDAKDGAPEEAPTKGDPT
jgi:hypothetical protein